ncbi:MAG: leucine-rich repeat domain-containing protein [Candidatus Poribacteria bacterium]|nr:leucine-rich repeat domain-containing protein [Candidatus Poribacteria bacterium]
MQFPNLAYRECTNNSNLTVKLKSNMSDEREIKLKTQLNYIKISCILMLILVGGVNAQQNLAQEAYAIFEQSCLICHGENGSFRESLIIEHAALIDDGKVIPGDPDGSVFFQRLIETNVAKRMPLAQPPLAPEAIETIRQWIAAGAPDWSDIPRPETDFITTNTVLQTIENHVNSLTPFNRSFARYFTLTHLYNAGETTEALNAYRRALSKLINSLSWGREVVKPQPIDAEQTIFYIDLRDYEWDVRNDAWTQIEQVYPYKMTFDAPTQTHLREKLTTLQQEMNCEVPFVHIDWFLATASLPPLYHDILALPETDRELEAVLEVFVTENLLNAPGKRVWRAGFNNSGVSRHNRVVERHISRFGAYWKSYDFAGSAESQNIFTHPLDFTHDGGEIIFNLPNGLQAYYLVDGEGNRLDVAPTDIVSNPAVSDPAVRNGLSCIGCHTEGMKTFEDEVRAVVEQADNPPFNKDRALNLYVERAVMADLVAEDTQRYRTALEAAGGVFGGIEPIQRFHEAFQGQLSAAHAAAAVGLETEAFLEKISKNVNLQNLLGALVVEGGAIKRDAWTSAFHDVIDALDSPDSVLPPVVERPEIIPGAGVYIPDVNLRAAIEEALGKAAGDAITVEDLTTLERLEVIDKDISDLTGLEFATNLKELNIEANKVSDLTPIAGLIELRVLNFVNNQISDLSPISELKKVNYLVINHNPISNISAIVNLTQLNYLQMSHISGVSDISVLAGLINLQTFHCWGSPIVDMSPLVKLPKLKILDLCGAKLSHIPSLDNLKSLKTLYLVDCNISDLSSLSSLKGLEHFTKLNLHRNNIISDISPLAVLTNLTWLNLSWNNISNVSSLSELTNLKWLSLELNNISDVSPLAKLTNLEWLDLTKNPITDFSPLAELAQTTNIIAGNVNIPDRNLRAAIAEALGKADTGVISITFDEMATLTTLRAYNRDITDLTGIEHAVNLDYLYAPANQITDLSPLSELIKLKILDIYNNPIESLSPIAGLSNLEVLTIIGDEISDISPLAGFAKLRHFLSWGNPISDLSPLAGLTQLNSLDICGADNPDFSPLAKLTGLKSLYLASNGISDVSHLSKLTSLTRLNLEWNKISDVSPLAALTQLKWLGLHHNLISDFSPLAELSETTISRAFNPGAPIGGPKIEGPWLWTIVPAEHLDSTTDLLSETSDGVVTEKHIATFGAKAETSVGDNMWIAGKIAPSGNNNIADMLDTLGIETVLNVNDRVIYGSIILNSPREQVTNMFFGSNNAVKIWLNGELVHQNLTWYNTRAHNYHDFFPATLKSGTNVLLVAIDYRPWLGWNGFFGLEDGTEYTVIHPDAVSRLTFSTTETTNLLAGDTFTLNLNAENVTDLAGWQADIVFDPNVLEAVEVTESDFLESEGGNTFFQGGTIDNTTGKITGLNAARIAESGVNGTGTLLSVIFRAKASGETQITLENFEFGSSTGAIIPTVPPNITITVGEYPAWDVNQDGRVSILDLILVAQDFGSGTPTNLRTDVNRDGVINVQDLILVAQHFGESTDSTAASPLLAMDNKELMPIMVQAWIDQAQAENDGSLAFRQGIENLERLLASLIPEKTALLTNYPNPFNPETWIPYHLAKPADVTLKIYAANGAVVRTLALGHQSAGIYQSRNRAAHWDGRNSVGESVASGIYFYMLTAGDFTATRKMLILK